MRLAVHGILADGVASGAGSFPLLLRGLLERGHDVEFFANPNYVRPLSLEVYPRYRFRPLRVEAAERAHVALNEHAGAYGSALASQFSHVAYEWAAKRRIEELHRETPYDFVLCTDAQSFLSSKLPVVSWPQSPPHTEAAALRDPAVARLAIAATGLPRYLAVQGFYAYRALLARSALRHSDLYLCASRWAADEWIRFGVAPSRVRLLPYPFELDTFANIPPVGQKPELTILWLGRAAPRKRLDLFLAAFAELRARRPEVRARLLGNLQHDPAASPLLARYRGLPGLSLEGSVPRAEVPRLLAEVDVVVQPSQNENFGFALAEALAAGRLVVGGSTNGTLEYAGDAGFRFTEYTPAAVAAAIQRALDAARARGAELSASASERALSFGIPSVVAEFCRIGDEVVTRARREGKHS